MLPPDTPVFPLAPAAEVDVAGIERELERLWREAARTDPAHSVLRAASFTLIYAAPETDGDDGTGSLLADLTSADPARAILLRLAGDETPHPLRAQVTAYCHRPSFSAPQICSEFIELHGSIRDLAPLQSVLLALRLSGIPAVLLWDSALRVEPAVLRVLAADVERVITAMIPPCAGAASLTSLLTLQEALGSDTLVTDAIESFLYPWQAAIAALFDSASLDARSIRRVRVFHSGSVVRAELALLAAWISVALSWDETNRPPASQTLQFSNEREIRFFRAPATIGSDYLEFEISGSAPSVLRCEEPILDNRQVTLLSRQLRIWGRDPVRDAAWERASRWLRLLG